MIPLKPLGGNKTAVCSASHEQPMISPHNVIHPCKPANQGRASPVTALNTSCSTIMSSQCQGDFRACLYFLPLVGGVELHRQHIQGVPGSDADPPKQAEEGNHGRLAVTEGQEETADTGDDAGARWRRQREVES